MGEETPAGRATGYARYLDRTPLGPHWLGHRALRRALARHASLARGRLLDVGGDGAPHRALFAGRLTRYVATGPPGAAAGVDVYAAATALPFRDGVFDTVLAVGVLALVPEPGRLLAEAARVLRPGGGLFLTAPWLNVPPAGPRGFYRYTERGLRHLLESSGFRVLLIERTTGLVASATQRLVAATLSGLHLDRTLPRALAGGLAAAAAQIPAAAADAALGHRGEPLDLLAIAERVTASDE